MRTRLLLSYASRYRSGWLLIAVVTVLSSVFSLAQPWPMKILVDQVLGKAPMPPALHAALAFLPGSGTTEGLAAWVAAAGLVVFGINSWVDVLLTRSWVRVGQGMVYDLAGDLFSRVQRRSQTFHQQNPVGDLMVRVTSDSWCVHAVVDSLLFAPGQVLLSAGIMLVLMVQMHPGLTLVSVAVAPLLLISSIAGGRRIRATAEAKRAIQGAMQSHLQQSLSGISVVQAFTREDREQRRFDRLIADSIRAQLRNTLVGGTFKLGSGLVETSGKAAVLWMGTREVMAGRLSVGALLVFLAYLTTLQKQLGGLTRIYSSLQGAAPSVKRVLEILETAPEVQEAADALPLPPLRGDVRLEQVTFGYDPARPVLRGVSLHVRPGETLALVGATGAGKSTLASLLPRFFDPDLGRVLLDGHDLRTVQLRSLREQVALVLQEPFLFPITIAQNIAYGRPDATPEQIEAAARAANAHAFIARLPQGYDTVVGERGATLSGGERQRLAIARALLKDAPVLILDEPTSALDAETERLLLEAVERLTEGRTTLVIAHRLSTIRRADRIVVLADGEVVEEGTHAELLAQGGRYAHLYRLQVGEPTAGQLELAESGAA